MNFTKMHGCGNDYIYINGFSEEVTNPSQVAIEMSDRHFGVGGDGIVLILPSKIADFKMRMFNADGSEAEMCGNAIRCVGKYVYDKHMTEKTVVTVETLAGIKVLQLNLVDDHVESVRVDMGEPILSPTLIPVVSEEEPVLELSLEALDKTLSFTCVSMGNPHAITFVEDTSNFDVHKYGPVLEVDKAFPKKANIEFAQVMSQDHIKMRVWERGSGETYACGTGACATLVAAVLQGKTNRKATLELLGGNLIIEWDEESNHVFMTGPCELVFKGVWLRS